LETASTDLPLADITCLEGLQSAEINEEKNPRHRDRAPMSRRWRCARYRGYGAGVHHF
jgi:hypothetical protein